MSAQSIKDDIFPCTGGLNLVTPIVNQRPGTVQACYNWEPTPTSDGYREIEGYERYDGRQLASLAADPVAQRALITVVPGSGPVRGVWVFDDKVYAFRDNALATACVMHQATATGWSEVDLGATIAFTAGTSAFLVGETLLGGTSNADATITRIEVTSGDWSTSNAAGTLWINDITGTFQAETVTSIGGGSATASGAQSAFSRAPGGTYRFVNANFYADAPAAAMYGVCGLDQAFAFDGTIYEPISTGATDDTPDFIASHKLRLFLGFSEGFVSFSEPGVPTGTFDALAGAGEFGIGNWLTNMAPIQGDVLGIYGERVIYLLYGSGPTDFELKPHSFNTGALTDTLQTLNDQLFLDFEGIRSLQTTDAFGDFASNTLSISVNPWLAFYRSYLIGSLVCREKNQYRLYFSDPAEAGVTIALTMGLGGEYPNFLPQRFPAALVCFANGTIAGEEWLLAGGSDGYVYRVDSGNSFDGAALPSMIRLSWVHEGTPGVRKRFREVRYETKATANRDMTFAYELNYADSHFAPTAADTLEFKPDGGIWGVDRWGSMTWGGFPRSRFKLTGSGTNIALILSGSRSDTPPVEINAVRLRYEPRRRY
ncbi:MAG: hypothetical protein HQL47_09835 [Gammaproteobacteria bacterium]|nr:hypothetical protein [Gammaproteobacteria bacterium]